MAEVMANAAANDEAQQELEAWEHYETTEAQVHGNPQNTVAAAVSEAQTQAAEAEVGTGARARTEAGRSAEAPHRAVNPLPPGLARGPVHMGRGSARVWQQGPPELGSARVMLFETQPNQVAPPGSIHVVDPTPLNNDGRSILIETASTAQPRYKPKKTRCRRPRQLLCVFQINLGTVDTPSIAWLLGRVSLKTANLFVITTRGTVFPGDTPVPERERELPSCHTRSVGSGDTMQREFVFDNRTQDALRDAYEQLDIRFINEFRPPFTRNQALRTEAGPDYCTHSHNQGAAEGAQRDANARDRRRHHRWG
jgi:hypothetical protein